MTETPAEPEETTPAGSEEPAPTPEETDALNIGMSYKQGDAMINNCSVSARNEAAPFVDAVGNAVSDAAINTFGAKAPA